MTSLPQGTYIVQSDMNKYISNRGTGTYWYSEYVNFDVDDPNSWCSMFSISVGVVTDKQDCSFLLYTSVTFFSCCNNTSCGTVRKNTNIEKVHKQSTSSTATKPQGTYYVYPTLLLCHTRIAPVNWLPWYW